MNFGAFNCLVYAASEPLVSLDEVTGVHETQIPSLVGTKNKDKCPLKGVVVDLEMP